jgi:hypothetical protein
MKSIHVRWLTSTKYVYNIDWYYLHAGQFDDISLWDINSCVCRLTNLCKDLSSFQINTQLKQKQIDRYT